MRCLQCGKRVSLLRKLTDGEFCSDEHRQLFQQQQNDLALARLIEAQQGMSRTRRQAVAAPAKPQAKSPAPAATDEKIPPFGDFLRLLTPALRLRRIHVLTLAMDWQEHEAAFPSAEFRTKIQGIRWSGGVTIPEAEALTSWRDQSGPGAVWLAEWPRLELPPYSSNPDITVPLPAAAEAPADPPMADLMMVGVSALEWMDGSIRLSGPVQAVATRGAARRLPAREGEETAPGPLAGLLPVRLALARMPLLWHALPISYLPAKGVLVVPCLRLVAEPVAGLLAAESVLALPLDLEALQLTARQAASAAMTVAWPSDPVALPLSESQELRHCLPAATRMIELEPAEACAAELAFRCSQPEGARHHGTTASASLPAASLQTEPFEFCTWQEQQTQQQPIEAEAPPLGEALIRLSMPAMAGGPAAVRSWVGTISRDGVGAFEGSETALPLLALELDQEQFHALLERLTSPFEVEAVDPVAEQAVELAAEPAVEEALEDEPPPLVTRLNPILVWRLCEPPPVEVRTPRLQETLVWDRALEAEPGQPRLALRPDNAESAASGVAEKTKKRAERTSLRSRLRLPESWKVWQHAPADLKWVAVGLPLILALVLYSFRGSQPKEEAGVKLATSQSQSILGGQFASLQKVIMQRAAIHLLDDFRGGLSAWEGKSGWAKSWKYGQATFLEPGQLAVYKPTLQMKDYTVEFLGQIERQGLSWVVRADENLRNYHVLRLAVTRPGPLPEAAIVRYTVVDGKEGPVTTLPLPFPIKLSTMYRVRVEVSGKEITTYVQGQVVDSFTDTRLRGGGVGFFAAKGEKALLRWVEVTHQYDYLGRFCAVLAPYDVQAGAERAD